MMTAQQALNRLKEGNARFVSGARGPEHDLDRKRPAELAQSQAPFATILGCSDSRVPAELVFDCGLGDLFVIRVAGNIVAPSQIGSVEFAAAAFGTPLVVVLGHSKCGAIGATLAELDGKGGEQSRNLRAIVDRVRPSVEGLIDAGLKPSDPSFYGKAVRANVRAAVDHLAHGSEMIEKLLLAGKLMVVGAEYSLETGAVDFFRLPRPLPPGE